MTSKQFWVLFACLLFFDCVKHLLTLSVGPAPLILDASHYWQLGQNAMTGDWLQLNNRVDFRTPLYPAFLGCFQYLFGKQALFAVIVVQHIVTVLTGWLTAFICWQVTGRRAAALVGYGFSVVCLTRIWFDNTALTESVFTFLMTASVGALFFYFRTPGILRSALFAFLLAMTVLIRPVPQLLWIPLVGLFFVECTKWGRQVFSIKTVTVHALVAVSVYFALLTPWYARNEMLFGEPFLTRLPAVNQWQVCFQDIAAANLPIPKTPAGKKVLELIGNSNGDVANRYCYAVEAALEEKGLSDEEISALVSQVCRDAIRENPMQFGWSAIKRTVNFWRCVLGPLPYYGQIDAAEFSGQEIWRNAEIASNYERVLANVPVQYLRWNEFVFVLTSIGTLLLIIKRETRLMGVSLLAIFAYFSAVTGIVEIENYRYRMVLEPCMIIAITCGFFVFYSRHQHSTL